MRKQLFETGHLYVASLANQELDFDQVIGLVNRHKCGDWGETCKQDAEANRKAVSSGKDRIFSVYMVGGQKVWVITEWDRSMTTVLLPEEY